MAKLLLPESLAEQFAGGLLAIIRTDGEINPTESMALQRVLAELVDGSIDIADAMMAHVTPHTLAKAIRDAAGSAYRGQSVSAADDIAKGFVAAAVRVAESDAGLSARETTAINNFAHVLGVPPIGRG